MKRGRTSRRSYGRRTRRRVLKRTGRSGAKTAARKNRRGAGIHYFKRNFNFGDLPGNAVYNPYLAANSFTLGQIPGIGDFTGLFDQYMITYIKLKFYLTTDPGAQTASTAIMPRMYWCKDYDDTTAPTSIDILRERNDVRTAVLRPDRPIVVKLKPSVLQEVYRSAVATTYAPKWKQMIDMTQTDVPHYGLKYAIDNFTNTNYALRVEGTMWFVCKGVR